MHGVTAQDHRPHLLKADKQDAVPWRVARSAQHHDGAVLEHILVRTLWLDLALLGDPLGEALHVRTAHRRTCVDAVPIALADKQGRIPKRVQLAGRSRPKRSFPSPRCPCLAAGDVDSGRFPHSLHADADSSGQLCGWSPVRRSFSSRRPSRTRSASSIHCCRFQAHSWLSLAPNGRDFESSAWTRPSGRVAAYSRSRP